MPYSVYMYMYIMYMYIYYGIRLHYPYPLHYGESRIDDIAFPSITARLGILRLQDYGNV